MSDLKMTKDEKIKHIMNAPDLYAYDTKELSPMETRGAFLTETMSVQMLEEQNDLIDQVLKEDASEFFDRNLTETGTFTLTKRQNLTKAQKQILKHKQTLNRAHLLVNNHEYTDSDAMINVKNDIRYFMETIDKYRNTPVTKDTIEEIEIAYSTVIASCNYYIDNKNPHFAKGIARKKLVQDLKDSVVFERILLSTYKESIVNDAEAGEKTLGDILGMSKEMSQGPQLVKKRNVSVPKNIKDIASALSPEADYDAFFRRYYFKSSALSDFHEIISIMKSFTPGAVIVKDVKMMGEKVRMCQKSDGRLFIIENGVQVPTNCNAERVLTNLQTFMLQHKEKFKKAEIDDIINGYEQEPSDVSDLMQVRGRLMTMLSGFSKKGRLEGQGLAETAFMNVSREKLVQYLKDYLADKSSMDRIIEEVKAENQKERLLPIQEAEAQAIRAKLKAEGEKSFDDVIKVEENWTKEQQSVKNMLSDMIYSNDIFAVEMSRNSPASFLKDIIKKHRFAVYSMLKDDNLVENVLGQMSLDGLNLNAPIAGVLKNITELLRPVTKDGQDFEAFKSGLSEGLDKLSKEKLTEIRDQMEKAVDDSCDILQENVNKMTETIFSQKEENGSGIKKGIRSKIREITNNMDNGQGLFIKTVLTNYFKDVSNMDKREMMSMQKRYPSFP